MYVCSNGVKTAVILQDKYAELPREPGYQDHITNMVCWHSRYNLGDKHDYKEPRDFAVDMVEKYLKPQDVFRAMANGELGDFRLVDNGDNGDYLVDAKVGFGSRAHWERMDWKVSRDYEVVEDPDATFDLEEDVLDNCWPDEMVRMCEKYGDVAVLPLYLYDHSGLSMSTGSFEGRAQHAQWDSGQVGYIYMDKETAMKELAMPTDEVRLAMELTGYKAKKVQVPYHLRNVDDIQVQLTGAMEAGGYSKVAPDDFLDNDVLKSIAGQACVEMAVEGKVFKKDNTLYVLDGMNLDRVNVLQSFDLKPIFSYNARYQPLTEENWRDRAEQVLEADVTEYDNYLRGEVYGYQCFEGMEEVDSCWGFNPGKEDIENLMNDELRGWFGADMEFEYESEDEFDIEEYFEENDFPELREQIERDVRGFVEFEDASSKVYPFGMAAEDILANKDGVLEAVVDEIYEGHTQYDSDRIFEVVQECAGVSRECMPKIRAEDLEPNREYTLEELGEVVREKGRSRGIVQEILEAAQRSCAAQGERISSRIKDEGERIK